MSLFEEYKALWLEAKGIYNDKFALLMQSGDFYEIYQYESNKHEFIGNVFELSKLLELSIFRKKDKNEETYCGIGFPMSSKETYIQILAEEAYIILLANQNPETDKKKRKTRSITRVIHPSMTFYSTTAQYLFCIYLKQEKKTDNESISISISYIDVTTGKVYVNFFPWVERDIDRSFSNLHTTLMTLCPKEILIYHNFHSSNLNSSNSVIRTSEEIKWKERISNNTLQFSTRIRWDTEGISKEYNNLSYQELFFKDIYSHISFGMMSPIEWMGLERFPSILISLILLYKYTAVTEISSGEKKGFLERLEKPIFQIETLILDNDALYLLEVYKPSKVKKEQKKDLYTLVDFCVTPMGKRLLYERLTQPIYEEIELKRRYDGIRWFLQKIEIPVEEGKSKFFQKKIYMYELFEKYLKYVGDLERYVRKIQINILTMKEYAKMHIDLENIILFLKYTSINTIEPVKQFLSFMDQKVIISENDCYFKEGQQKDIDQLNSTIKNCNSFFEILGKEMSRILNINDAIKYSWTASEGYFLKCTMKRWLSFLEKNNGKDIIINNPFIDGKTIKIDILKFNTREYTDSYKIKHPSIEEYSNLWLDSEDKKEKVKIIAWKLCLQEMIQYLPFLKLVSTMMAEWDVFHSGANCAIQYHYTYPIIPLNSTSDSLNEESYVIAKGLRHPLEERKEHRKEVYVSQNIDFQKERGILLFGINGGGKSILLKAVALSIILSQAGFYVPATEFIIRPYKNILPRLKVEDDRERGKSTFMVEMAELKAILERSNKNSFIIADEFGHSTDTDTALAMCISLLRFLSSVNSNFLFTTHFYQLTTHPSVLSLENIKMKHIKIRIQSNGNENIIYYERLLDNGPGNADSNVEVAKALGIPKDFMENVVKERNILTGKEDFKKSRYNSNVYIGICQIEGCNEKATQTHHIQFQSHADENGFIKKNEKEETSQITYVHEKSNLMGICDKHHEMVHHNLITIKGYQQTNQGIRLCISFN